MIYSNVFRRFRSVGMRCTFCSRAESVTEFFIFMESVWVYNYKTFYFTLTTSK
jgi:hypothetical protein